MTCCKLSIPDPAYEPYLRSSTYLSRLTRLCHQRIPNSSGFLALRSCFSTRIHLTKLVHGQELHCNRRVHKYDHTLPTKCPLCNYLDEERDHIIRCSHTTHITSRSVFLTAIRERFDDLRRTCPILTGESDLLHGSPTAPLLPTDTACDIILSSEMKTKLDGDAFSTANWRSDGWNYRQNTFSVSRTRKTIFKEHYLWTSASIQAVWSRWQLVRTQPTRLSLDMTRKAEKKPNEHTSKKYTSREVYSRRDLRCDPAILILSLPPLNTASNEHPTQLRIGSRFTNLS
jgi:hypothetical protein